MTMSKSSTLLAALFALPVAACGGGNQDVAPPPPPPVPSASATPPPVEPPDAGATAVAPPPEEPWQVLADLDSPPASPAIEKPEAIEKLAGVTAKNVKKSAAQCKGANDLYWTVDGGYTGAFTAAGKTQQLYLVGVEPCPKNTKAHHEHTLLVVDGGKVVLKQALPENNIVAVGDVDQDGDNEILVINDEGASVSARLVDTEDGKFEQLFDFKEVAAGTCKDGKATGDGAVIKYRKHATSMEYKSEKKPKTCPAK